MSKSNKRTYNNKRTYVTHSVYSYFKIIKYANELETDRSKILESILKATINGDFDLLKEIHNNFVAIDKKKTTQLLSGFFVTLLRIVLFNLL